MKDGHISLASFNLATVFTFWMPSPIPSTMCSKITKLIAPPNFAMCDFSCTLQFVGFRVSNIISRRKLKMELNKEKWKGVTCLQLQNWNKKAKYSKNKY
jgi:hypothetical protein